MKQELEITLKRHFQSGMDIYKHMLEMGIAKECARFVLPLAVPTRIYMTGSVRSWIHYIELRSANGTQKEHMDIALDAKTCVRRTVPYLCGGTRLVMKTLTLEDYQKAGESFEKYWYIAKELGEDAKPEQVLKVMEAIGSVALKTALEEKLSGPFGFNKKEKEDGNVPSY